MTRAAATLRPPRDTAIGVSLVVASVVVGFAAVALVERIGPRTAPALLVALAILPAVALAVLYRPLLGVAAVFLAFPIGSVSVPIPLGGIAPPLVELTVLAVAALVALRRLALGETPLRWPDSLWWALGLLAWTLISFASAEDQVLALKQISVLAGGIVFACLVYTVVESMNDLRRICGAYIAVAIGLSVAAVGSGTHFQDQFGGEVVSGRLTGAFNHPNQLGLYAVIAVCLSTGLAFGAQSRAAKITATCAAGFMLVPLLLSLSRGAWIGCGLAFLYLLVSLREARRALIVVGVPVMIVAAIVGSFAPSNPEIRIIGERARAITAISPYDDRPAIYREAERQIRANPIVGVGPGNYPVASARALFADATVANDHAHNLWLTWAAESGLPSVMLILALVISVGRVAHRAGKIAGARSRLDRAVLAGIVASLLAVLGQGIFDYLLRNVVLFMTVWMLIGAALACGRIYRDPEGRGA